MFRYEDDGHIINERGKAVDVSGGHDNEGRNIIMWKKHNGKNQLWDIEYVKNYKELKNGEWNTQYGFRCNIDFHIASDMSNRRFIDIHGGRLAIRRPDFKRRSQNWYFDCTTNRIRNRSNNYAMNALGNGG